MAESFVQGYQGVIQTYGYRGYEFIDHVKEICIMGCSAHMRRKFVAVGKVSKKESQDHYNL